jgi:hypothetical protein
MFQPRRPFFKFPKFIRGKGRGRRPFFIQQAQLMGKSVVWYSVAIRHRKVSHCQQVKKGEHYRRQRIDKFYPQDKPFLTLLPLAPKVFAKQKRFFATPTCFLQAVESLTC